MSKQSDIVLALDVDETILHTFNRRFLNGKQYQWLLDALAKQDKENMSFYDRIYFPIVFGEYNPNESSTKPQFIVMLRPGFRTFIQKLYARGIRYGIYSAGAHDYIETLLSQVLFPKQYYCAEYQPHFVLHREHCYEYKDDNESQSEDMMKICKPLQFIKYYYPRFECEEKNILLLDDKKDNAKYHPTQLILSPCFVPSPWSSSYQEDKFLHLDVFHSIASYCLPPRIPAAASTRKFLKQSRIRRRKMIMKQQCDTAYRRVVLSNVLCVY